MRIARARPLLGTYVEMRIDSRSNAVADAALARAFAAVERVHAAMSFHEPSSELSRLNAAGHRRAIRLSPALHRVLGAACRLHALSDGAFDVAVGGDLQRCGVLPGRPRRGTGRSDDIRFLPDRHVRFARPLSLDLGGIAKGYAVDRAVAALRRAGIRQGVVNAGGDLRVFGARAEVVHVRDAADPGRLRAAGRLSEGAIATSAGYFHRAGDGTPIIDPDRGNAIPMADSISILAPTCMMADALTKVVALRGDAAMPLLKHLRARRIHA